MKCPACGGKVKILDTRQNDEDHETYRHRRCEECSYDYYTTEYEVEPTMDFMLTWQRFYRDHLNRNPKLRCIHCGKLQIVDKRIELKDLRCKVCLKHIYY